MTPKSGGRWFWPLAVAAAFSAAYLAVIAGLPPGSRAIGGQRMQTKWTKDPVAKTALDRSAPSEYKTATFALG